MDQHEYVAGFFGVLIGFTLTELLKGIAETLRNLEKVKYYYPHGLMVILTLFIIILNFMDFYKYMSMVDVWTASLLIRYTFPSVFVCFLTYLLFLAFTAEDKVDFRIHYFKVVPILQWLAMGMIVLVLIRNILFMKLEIINMSNTILFILFFACLLSLKIKKDWSQYGFLAMALPSIIYWTLSLKLG